jgi:predicted RNA-binding Zn-ribbon protein involved in translation (DUF1610 family)
MNHDNGRRTCSAAPPTIQAQSTPCRVKCDNCGATKGGEDPLDAIDAADRAGWRLVDVNEYTSQLCPGCLQSRLIRCGEAAVWRLCDEFVRRLAGKPRRELPLMPPRGAIKEVVVHAAMLSAATVFAAEYLDRLLPLSWWMRRGIRIEPLSTARQVAIVLLAQAGLWNKSSVARSFGRSPAVSHQAERVVSDRATTDNEFRDRFAEAQRRFKEALGLINGEARL